MSLGYLNDVIALLRTHGISSCILGELAQNYFNVPRMVHLVKQAIEIGVPFAQYEKTKYALDSQQHLLERLPQQEHSLFTEYQRHCPRYRHMTNSILDIVLTTDDMFGMNFMNQIVISKSQHSEVARYSGQILGLLSVADLHITPIPALPHFLRGVCEIYKETRDIMFAIVAEQPVDGMNIDANWCRKHFRSSADEADFLKELIRDKAARIDDISTNLLTCFISNGKEAEKLEHITGRN